MAATKAKTIDTPETPRYSYGTGRRKTAVAQVRLIGGGNQYQVNDVAIERPVSVDRLLEMVGEKDATVFIHVHGGGKIGQEAAILHGLARALIENKPDLRPTLKKAGFLTRDPREKERKKYGLHGARRGPQFSKR